MPAEAAATLAIAHAKLSPRSRSTGQFKTWSRPGLAAALAALPRGGNGPFRQVSGDR
jgi:hypothetical protein